MTDNDNNNGEASAAGASSDSTPSQSPQGGEEQGGANSPDARERSAHGWPLQADRMAIQSPLVECLKIMAGHYGRRTSAATLTAGLPIPPQGITPALFVRAAERVDLKAKLVERSIEALAIAPNFPCVLSLQHNQACIIWQVRHPKGHEPKSKKGKSAPIHPKTRFLVQFPETDDEKQVMTLEQLQGLYTG